MNHKVTLNLFDVHPYFKVNFTIYLDYIDKQDGTKFNFPVVNKFMFDGNEYLKEHHQMEWAQAMNNIKNRAEEIVLNEIIYV